MKTNICWEWDEFGIGVMVFKNSEILNYKLSIDIQIGFLDIYIQLFKRRIE